MTAPRFVALPLVVAALALAGPAVVTPTSVQGSSFTVDSPFDDVDVSPGDGLCGTSTGVCTLRAAVQEANALPGPDAVSLPEGTYELRIKGSTGDAASGDLDIAEDLAISGAGADTTVIDGGFVAFGTSLDDHAFSITSGVAVTIEDVTIQGFGDLFLPGGGIVNAGTLLIDRVLLTDNIGNVGGGIYNAGGTLVVENGRFVRNGGGTAESAAGGILNVGRVELNEVLFSRNGGGLYGGAIWNRGSTLASDITVEDNVASSCAGILNSGQLTIDASIFSRNSLGAICNHSDGVLTGHNLTVSENAGAGLDSSERASSALANVTITGNRLGVYNLNGPPLPNPSAFPNVALVNSMVTNNGDGNCLDTNPTVESVISEGRNLSSDDSCPFSAAGDMQSPDPLLGPLADNGGPTQTHALLPGSPAIDAGDSVACPLADQRGVARPLDGDSDGVAVCDIGAFEAAAGTTPPSPSPSPSPTSPPSPPNTPTATTAPVPSAAQAGGLPAALPRTGGRRSPAKLSSALPIPLGAWAPKARS